MTRLGALVPLLCILAATPLGAATAPDLRSRISIDGKVTDFETDEWILDSSTAFSERPGDSRWGLDNDITAIAVTWDFYNLYIAVPAVTTSGTLMLFLDTMCGGAEDLTSTNYFRRNIEFGSLTANLLISADRISGEVLAGYMDCTRSLNLVGDDIESVYLQDGARGGALEIALPWEILGDFERVSGGVRLPDTDAVLRILSVVTAGDGSGAGDAAPDPSVVLEGDSTRVAVADNHAIIPLDEEGDGFLDAGVSPRAATQYAVSAASQGTNAGQVLALRIPLDRKVYAPSQEAEVSFTVVLDSDYAEPVYLDVRIYSSAGYVVRSLAEESPVDFSTGDASIDWDFKDDRGDFVPGGIYIFAVSGGAGKGTPKSTAKAAFSVLR